MATRALAGRAVTFCLGAMIVSCQGLGGASETGRRIELPDGVTAPWAAISPGGRGWAYGELGRSEAFVVVNGRRRGPYPWVCGPELSRDGERVAFVTWKGGRNVVIHDGEPGEEFDAISWPLALSADGTVVAYQARRGQDQFCVVGNRKSRGYPSVGLPVLSQDGTVVAFAASDGDGWRVLRNGKPGPRFDWVGNLILHPGGVRLAYTAESRDAGKLRTFVVVDGVAGPPFDRVTPPVVSGDGRTVAYAGLREGGWGVVVGTRETPVVGEVTRVILSQDGAGFGTVVDEGRHRRVIGPSGRGDEFDWIGDAVFLKDGRIAALAARGARKYLSVEDHAIPLGSGEVRSLVPFADGTRVGVEVREERTVEWKVLPIPARRGSIAKE